MYSVLNKNGQLALAYSNSMEYYEFQTFKSVSSALDTLTSRYYVSINFIDNDKNNSLRLYLSDIDNQATWTDTALGAQQAVDDISTWIAAALVPSLSGTIRQAFTRRVAGSTDIISDIVYSISFASVGTGNALVSSDAGSTFSILKPGETISFSAGDINNYFEADRFIVNTTALNAEILIVYTY
jgi:hypothetical protein